MAEFSAEKSMLTFVTTNECSARCRHCLMLSSPKRHEKLDYAFMKKAIDEIAVPQHKRLIVFTGGESTRLGNELYDTIAYANSLGLGTRLVTNAEWAVSEKQAGTVIGTLNECGLNELNISYDDFHAEFIPLNHVVRAWKTAEDRGRFNAIVLAVCSGPISKVTPESLMSAIGEDIPLAYDEQGNELPLPERKPGETRKLISNSRILRLGRGRKLDIRYCKIPDQQFIEQTPCPADNRQPVFMPSRHRCTCCGINPEFNKVLDLDTKVSEHFRDVRTLLLRAIGEFGPGYLMNLVKKARPDIRFRDKYSGICEICSDVTRSQECLRILADNRQRIIEDLKALDLIRKASDAEEAAGRHE